MKAVREGGICSVYNFHIKKLLNSRTTRTQGFQAEDLALSRWVVSVSGLCTRHPLCDFTTACPSTRHRVGISGCSWFLSLLRGVSSVNIPFFFKNFIHFACARGHMAHAGPLILVVTGGVCSQGLQDQLPDQGSNR